jgi:hypothetical protein
MSPLVQLILQSIPGIIGQIQDQHRFSNPSAPVPTPEEIVQAFEDAFTSTIFKDEAIKAANQ